MKSIAQANVIAQWIEQTRGGDEGAAAELWQHCYFRVAAFARKRMRGAPISIADEEDIATSAMKSLCVGLRAGKFQSLTCDDALWRLLLVITARKVFDQVNYATRSKRDVLRSEPQSRFESEDWLAQTILSRSPSPETEAAVSEQLDRLLHSLGPRGPSTGRRLEIGWIHQRRNRRSTRT